MTAATAVRAPARPDLRTLLVFAAVAVGVGGTLFALSTLVEPGEPFLLAGVYLGLAVPALVLTRHERWSDRSPDASPAVCPVAEARGGGCWLRPSRFRWRR